MKSLIKLKDDARKHEQREEWDKAIHAYLQVLQIGEEGESELDLPLYNRVGDLYLRLSRPNDAVKYYVQAADRYAEAGLFNNAIALCNKALRYVPQQLDLLRKLGQFSASQGFLTDARRYFLEFAEKKFAAGQVNDALTALEEFAEASDDPEIRVMLARQLHSRSRTAEAVDELKKAYAVHTRNGAAAEATAVQAEIESIAPGAMSEASTVEATPYQAAPGPVVDTGDDGVDEYAFSIDSSPVSEPPADADVGLVDIAAGSLEGFESTQIEVADTDTDTEPGGMLEGLETLNIEEPGTFDIEPLDAGADDLGLEPTSFVSPEDIAAAPLADLEFDDKSFGDGGSAFDLPLLPADSEEDAALSLDGGDEAAGFDLPSFEIELAADGGDSGEGDGYFDDDAPFELPMLEGEDPGLPAPPTFTLQDFSDAGAVAAETTPPAGAHISPDMDFGEFGMEPPPPLVFTGRREEAAAIEESFVVSEPTAEDTEAAEFVEELVAESETTPVFWDLASPTDAITAEPPAVAEEAADVMPSIEAEEELPPTPDAELPPEPQAAHATEPEDIRETEPEAALPQVESAPEPPTPAEPAVRDTPPTNDAPVAPATPRAADTGFINLGALLAEDDEETAGTRFVVQEKAPTGDEDQDFAELLSQFKQ
jgi:hypothetical protein